MKSIYETTGKGYEQVGDYLLPNLRVEDEKEYYIGVWGQRYRQHLKEHHKIIYYNYLTKGTLYEHLAEVDNQAKDMFNQLVKSLAEKENVTEKLKADNMMEWVQKTNNMRNRATEIVNEKLIYV